MYYRSLLSVRPFADLLSRSLVYRTDVNVYLSVCFFICSPLACLASLILTLVAITATDCIVGNESMAEMFKNIFPILTDI